MSTDNRHTAAIAMEEFEKANRNLFGATGLDMPAKNTQYLRNRICLAYQAGWDDAVKHCQAMALQTLAPHTSDPR